MADAIGHFLDPPVPVTVMRARAARFAAASVDSYLDTIGELLSRQRALADRWVECRGCAVETSMTPTNAMSTLPKRPRTMDTGDEG